MNGCPGLHCPGCRDHPGRAAGSLGAAAAVIALVAEFAAEILVTIGTAVALALALAAVLAVRAWRRGWRPRTVIAWDPYTPLPEPEPARALPAPQTVTNNYFYGVTPEQVAGAIARQQIEGR